MYAASSAGNNLSDSINLQVMKHLEDVFHSADKDGSGQLDMEEFVKAFKGAEEQIQSKYVAAALDPVVVAAAACTCL